MNSIKSLALLASLLTTAACEDRSEFDSAKWKEDAGCLAGNSDRILMANDLGETYLSIGMSEQEVIVLLGEPEERRDATFIYCLGRAMIDYDFFLITFDGEAGVTSFQHFRG